MLSKNNLKYISITAVILIILISGSLFYTLRARFNPPLPNTNTGNELVNQITGSVPALAMDSFRSCQDILGNMEDFYKLQNQSDRSGFGLGQMPTATNNVLNKSLSAPTGAAMEAGSPVFSGTNNQVQNVDEGDIIKTDGKNIFTVNGRNINITQVDGQNGNISKSAKISISGSYQNVTQLNLYQNYLVVTGQGVANISGLALVSVYDISEIKQPILVRELAMDGDISTTRMVDGVVYLVNNFYNYQFSNILNPNTSIGLKSSDGSSVETPKPLNSTEKIQQIQQNLPKLSDSLSPGKTIELAPCEKIKYIRPIQSLEFMTVLALDLKNPKGDIGKEVVMGSSQNVYASDKNLYLTQTNYNYNYFNSNQAQKTNIFKFNLNRTAVKFQTQGQIAGTILNQFSMDEFEDNLRVSSHLQQSFREGRLFPNFMGSTVINPVLPGGGSFRNTESNNITILDADLKQIGAIENIAPGEQIYATRFMGKKGYLVTFKTVDPLFAMDLSDPKNPKITGELKIPGYSDYLHPISENLLIGVGKNATEAVDSFGDSTGFAWYQGLKLGLFDVSDMSNPKELGQVEIGERGTDSAVLNDHKALLWDSRNNLLTIPVTLMLIPAEEKVEQEKNIANRGAVFPLYGQFKYQGSYVYEVTKENGFKFQGRVSHIETKAKEMASNPILDRKFDEFGQLIETNLIDTTSQSRPSTNIVTGEPFPGQNDYLYYINRQLYINNFLITFSPKQLQSNKIQDLSLVNNIGF